MRSRESYCASSTAGADCRRARGRSLGRRGDARRAAVARSEGRGRSGTGDRQLPRRRAPARRSGPDRARRARDWSGDRSSRAGAAVAGGGRGTGRAARRRRGRAVPQDGGKPVLCHGGAWRAGAEQVPRDHPRRRACAGRTARARWRRTVLEAVAVVPQQAELWLVEALAGDAREGLDECLASGMLTLCGRERCVPTRARARCR